MAWGLFPMLYSSLSLNLKTIGILAAVYPAAWGMAQIATGYLSDRIGRKQPIAWGMMTQAVGIFIISISSQLTWLFAGNVLLGLGTALVYPTLLAAICNVAHPSWRASSVGIYRLWRDSGYAAGAIIAGLGADFFGLRGAIAIVATLTATSALVVIVRMTETKARN